MATYNYSGNLGGTTELVFAPYAGWRLIFFVKDDFFMEWMGLNELRERFLSFFESKGHSRLPSFPLVPNNDKSLLLINSGMAPMKKWFLGQETPPNVRVTTCQKCIRTPDIERVGKTARHGTYFEMLGNFSFGDYFKKEATQWAWEFFVEELGFPVDRLYCSIFEDDNEAYDIWVNERHVDPAHIVRLGREDNFWEHGSGPCGPCSEIYFDRGEEYGCGSPDCAPGCDCDRFIEIWNLVFSQFDSDGEGHYAEMEHKNIDTGMGLERLACVMQGVDNLFEVDTVQNILQAVCKMAGVNYHDDEKTDVSIRVITDHVRSTTFMISDGVMPANDGRGYVLKRLLRRAARHGRLLGLNEPFVYKIVDTVIEENKGAYPELSEHGEYIKKVILSEEERFCRTIDAGFELLNGYVEKIENSKSEKKVLPGEIAFKLYDTFGFPLDLTEDILEEKGITVDEDAFHELMNEQKTRAREARASQNGVSWVNDALVALGDQKTKFVGYDRMDSGSKIVAILRDGEMVSSIEEGEEGVLVLDATPFYAEMGGQVGDRGAINDGPSTFTVEDCRRSPTGQYLHIGRMGSGLLRVGDGVRARVTENIRRATMRNHTACHLLQKALRDVLGEHVHQAGSYVDEHRCRFDFTHFEGMTSEEIAEVEDIVNNMVLSALDVDISEMPIDKAKELGAMALFGEKYGDIVRVVNVSGRSVEFCGGTHVDNTSRIGLFKILSESSVAAGVRRIEATTGTGVLEYIDQMNEMLLQTAATLKVNGTAEIPQKTVALTAELKNREKEISALNDKLAQLRVEALLLGAKEVAGIRVITGKLTDVRPDTLRIMGDHVKFSAPDCVAVLAGESEGKASILVVCGIDALKEGAHAGKIVKEICALTGGSGGGRPDSAMGGAGSADKVDEALASACEIIETLMINK